ncbi:hypothetical protein ACJIZ3_017103 [Penstemon smallii]|uniref:Uncharacterized protein n=1 Tax=Penstemon smallii TaxID=265156 RepID=A0ABD3SV81_9LAMI
MDDKNINYLKCNTAHPNWAVIVVVGPSRRRNKIPDEHANRPNKLVAKPMLGVDFNHDGRTIPLEKIIIHPKNKLIIPRRVVVSLGIHARGKFSSWKGFKPGAMLLIDVKLGQRKKCRLWYSSSDNGTTRKRKVWTGKGGGGGGGENIGLSRGHENQPILREKWKEKHFVVFTFLSVNNITGSRKSSKPFLFSNRYIDI